MMPYRVLHADHVGDLLIRGGAGFVACWQVLWKEPQVGSLACVRFGQRDVRSLRALAAGPVREC